jgi:Cft2 family RNA processing exonuclease
MPFGQPLTWDNLTLTTHPAGHVFGSAMLQVAGPHGTLLYTGDFKLRPSSTAETAAPPGDPRYRLPPRDEVIAQLALVVRRTLDAGRTPVVQAYVLGKAQEVTRILSDAGFRVVQHPLVYAISEIYQAHGCDLGTLELCDGPPPDDAVVVAPPRSQKSAALVGLRRPVTIAVTGWAVDPAWRYRLGADYALPLSDHADFDELVECVERVEPEVIFCTHGPAGFVEILRRRGFHAHALAECHKVRSCRLFQPA